VFLRGDVFEVLAGLSVWLGQIKGWAQAGSSVRHSNDGFAVWFQLIAALNVNVRFPEGFSMRAAAQQSLP